MIRFLTSPELCQVSKTLLNFWLDVLLMAVVVVIGWVTAVLQFVFPAGTAARGWMLWGASFDDWRDVQFGTLCVFAVCVVVHVMLHWKWVCAVLWVQILRRPQTPDAGLQTIYGVVLLIVLLHLLGAGVIAASLGIKRPAETRPTTQSPPKTRNAAALPRKVAESPAKDVAAAPSNSAPQPVDLARIIRNPTR